MLTEYIRVAMRHAHYEIIEGSAEPYWGNIPELQGVWGTGLTLEDARMDLQGALEAWLVASLSHQLPVPEIDGVSLQEPVAV